MNDRFSHESSARAGQDPLLELAQILRNDCASIAQRWLNLSKPVSFRGDLTPEQAEEFLALFTRAVAAGTRPNKRAKEWALASESLIRSVGGAGLAPSEAIQPLVRLKESLFIAIRHTYPGADAQIEVILQAASTIDELSLLIADSAHFDAMHQAQTSHQLVEAELINTREFKERIVESSPDCLKVLDADARLMWMSENGKQLMEVCEFGQLRGASWLEFWDGAAQECAREAVAQAKAGKIGRFEGPCATICGTPKWWNVVVAPIFDERGEVAQLLSVSRDITEQKRVETALREREIELENAIGFRENLLAVVSHDLRNPLSAIDMNIALLQKTTNDEWSSSRLAAVEHASDRMVHLIDDLVDMAGIQAGRLNVAAEPQDIGALLREAVEMQQPLARSKGIELELSAERSAKVNCDRERMLQVAGNLIGNAIKFCGTGGAITVGVGANDQHVQFAVADTGPGIASADIPHVFDLYWSAQKDRTGAGLGLYICKGIIEAHGGRIWAESPPGAGAKFSVELPRQ
ncbi:PAS domain-containing protein [Proteobacteria bacterium 005FR1]|nr:PAS domain-containing protein [Proteobacteria bacterium 005FR1]